MDAILRLRDEVVSYHQARDDLVRELRQLRFMQRPPELPRAVSGLLREVIRTPLAFEQVRRVVGILTVHPPRFTAIPNGSSERVEADADQVEKWLNLLWPQLERRAGVPLFQKFVDHIIADGLGVLKLVYEPWRNLPLPEEGEDPAEYAQRFEEALRRQPLPFAVQVLDPLLYYPVRGASGQVEAVFEVGNIMRSTAMQAYGPRAHRYLAGASRGHLVRYTEFWDMRERRVYLNDRLLLQEEHGLAYLPYFEAGGEVTAASDPARAYASFIYPMRYLLPALDTVLNIKAIWGLIRALPPMVRQGPAPLPTPGAVGEAGGATVMRLAEIYEGVTGEIRPIEIPDVGKDLDQTVTLILSLIDRAGLSPVMAGIAPGARTPGYALSELRQAATSRLQGVVQNVSAALASLAMAILWLVANRVGERVYIYGPLSAGQPKREWVHIAPRHVQAVADIDVNIVWRLPTDDIAMGQHAAGMYRAGLWSWETAARQSGIENVSEERMRLLKEKVYALPEVQQQLLQRALEMAGGQAAETPVPAEAAQGIQEMLAAMQAGGASPQPQGAYSLGPGPGNVQRVGQPVMPGVGMEIGLPNRPGPAPETQAQPRFAARRGRAAGAERRPGGRKPPPTPFGGGS